MINNVKLGVIHGRKFDVKLVEEMKYYTPNPEYKRNSWLGDYQKAYDEFLADPDAFWSNVAQQLDWIKPWDAVKEWKYPYAKVVYECKTQHHCQLS